jgi:hypothetical protein
MPTFPIRAQLVSDHVLDFAGDLFRDATAVFTQDFIADPLLQQVFSWAALLDVRGQPFTSAQPQVHMAPRVATGKIFSGSLRQ